MIRPTFCRRCLIVAALLSLAAVLLLLDARAAQTTRGKKYALLVGVREYEHRKLRDLKYTENDVTELADVLSKAGFDEVVLLTSTKGKTEEAAQPTAANIRKHMKRLLDKVSKRDIVLIALAGHGVQFRVTAGDKDKDESFFCPADAKLRDTKDLKDLSKTMLPLGELFKELDDSGAGARLLLVDACRNDPTDARNLDVDALPRPANGTAVLFSCKSGEVAFETAKLGKGHGVFFHFVLEGLKGKASNDDSEVTWDHLTAYVKGQVMRQVPRVVGGGATQTPHLLANVEGDPVLRLLEKTTSAPPTDERITKPTSQQTLGKKVSNSIGMQLVRIEPGKFTMGSATEEYAHQVKITRAFYMGVYPVTQAEFRAVMGTNTHPSYFSEQGYGREKVKGLDTGRFPVERQSWADAVQFCQKLTALKQEQQAKRVYRLPTEAEWEYACRAGTTTVYSFGDSISSTQANFNDHMHRTCLVGSYKPNAWGLYDMHGNVRQWCADWYDKEYYKRSREEDPQGPASGTEHVVRGGGWLYDASDCRAGNRLHYVPSKRSDNIGFRVVCVPALTR